jgi:hypothetical protein
VPPLLDFSSTPGVATLKGLHRKLGGLLKKKILLRDKFFKPDSPKKWSAPLPQVLGPVLFIICINDLPYGMCESDLAIYFYSQTSDIFLFADDEKLHRILGDIGDPSRLQWSCQILFDLSEQLYMRLNTDKYKILSVIKNKLVDKS